jgi:hypothetical protein
MRPLLTLLLPLLLTGCTAGRASYMLINAEREYQTAVEQGADQKAVYEITLAHEYLQKAKEEAGYSDYGPVDQLCKTSITWSQSAYKKSSDEVPETNPEVVPDEKLPNAEQPTAPPSNEPVINLDDP